MELLACYGELFAPDSMFYQNKSGTCVIEVFASNSLEENKKQEMMAEIDGVIRKYHTIKAT